MWHSWYGGGPKKDFKKASEEQKKNSKRFSNLLKMVASNFPEIRIRFSTSNPQDMTIDVIETMAEYENICNYIHLPIQSGSDRILKKMNRLHTSIMVYSMHKLMLSYPPIILVISFIPFEFRIELAIILL